jgi:hypothetical protein
LSGAAAVGIRNPDCGSIPIKLLIRCDWTQAIFEPSGDACGVPHDDDAEEIFSRDGPSGLCHVYFGSYIAIEPVQAVVVPRLALPTTALYYARSSPIAILSGQLPFPFKFMQWRIDLVSRKYPLDMLPEDDGAGDGRAEPKWTTRAAASAADMLLDLREWRLRHQDISRLFVGITMLIVGLVLAGGAGITDNYLHRGVESGTAQPYMCNRPARDWPPTSICGA